MKVDIAKSDRELMAAIGHELRHAIEVLSDPRVTDLRSMYIFYKRNRDRAGTSTLGTSTAFETKAAIEAGKAVADEIGRQRRSTH